MNIEFSQILTHMVGFLIALAILAKFAWKPMLAMLDERREKIATEFQRIEAKKADAEKLLLDYEQRLRKIEEEARLKLNEAVQEGQQVAGQLKADAQEEARKIVSRAKSELARDVAQARSQLKADMVAMTISATEKLLREKLDTDANRKLVTRFLDEVEAVA
jgi:F-type H+-transporting ATPase subunit b